LAGFDAVFGEQPVEDHQIANGFMASVPKHSLWKTVFAELNNSNIKHRSNVLHSTGPYMISRAIHKYLATGSEKQGVKVFGPKYFFPLLPFESGDKKKRCIESSEDCRKIYPEAFAVEHWSKSW
jgi:hypothetical protein